MQRVARFLLLLVAILAAGGCATSGPKYSDVAARAPNSPSGELGRIYIYRTALYGAAVQPEVKINGTVVGRAVPNGYFYVDEKPGAYEITATTEVERKLSLTLEKGQVRYVKLGLGLGFFVGHVYPELVDSDVAQKEIQDLRHTGN
jgi:hypothetical protein